MTKYKITYFVIWLFLLVGCISNNSINKTTATSNKKISASDSGQFDSAVLFTFTRMVTDSQFLVNELAFIKNHEARLKLGALQIKNIVNILNAESSNISADCYNPHHALLFYNKGKVNAFYEFCLECGGDKKSSNLFFPDFCKEKASAMASLLSSYGVYSYIVE